MYVHRPVRRADARVAGAPILLTHEQVAAYSARITNAINSLDSAIESRRKAKGISGDETHNTPYNKSDMKLPYAWWVSWIRFKNQALQFDENVQKVDWFGTSTIWANWAAVEANESQYNQFKKDFVSKYDGLSQDTAPVPQDQIDREHPTASWFPSAFSVFPWAVILGAGAAIYFMTTAAGAARALPAAPAKEPPKEPSNA